MNQQEMRRMLPKIRLKVMFMLSVQVSGKFLKRPEIRRVQRSTEKTSFRKGLRFVQ